MLASVPFLLITLIVYGCISELRNLPGKCLMCYVFCLLIFCIQFPLTLIYKDSILNYTIVCKLSGYTEMAILLMSFLWLNVMCYDVWSTIRQIFMHVQFNLFSLKYIRKVQKANDDWKIFFGYCAYAFLFPILVVSTIFFLHQYDVIPQEYQHKLGKVYCLMSNDEDIRKIYFLPITVIMMSINIIFYTITAYTLYKIQKQTTKLFANENTRYAQNRRR